MLPEPFSIATGAATLPPKRRGARAEPRRMPGRTAREVLDGVSRELSDLGEQAERLQHATAGLIGGQRVDMQGLDHLTQSLVALSGFVAGIARRVDAGGAIDLREALGTVTLGAMAHRLAFGEPAAANCGAAGSLDLFTDDGP